MTRRAPKPITAWVVQACGGRATWLVGFTIRTRRTEAKDAWLALWEKGPGTRWSHWRRKGYRLVRCTVTPTAAP